MSTITVTIKNETNSFTLETSPSESIAGVKVRSYTSLSMHPETIA